MTEWESYVGSVKTFRRDTALFPMLDRECPDREDLLVDRFRWFVSSFGDDPEELFSRWKTAEDFFTEERRSNADIPLAAFHRLSTNLAFVMAKQEVVPGNLRYLKELRDELKIRSCRKGSPVIVVGPTFGGEVEAIESAGGYAHLAGDESLWRTVTEERLFHDRVNYESIPTADTYRNLVGSRYFVISSWVPDPIYALRSAYNALEGWGFVCFPATNTSLGQAASELDLRQVGGDHAAVYLKHPALKDFVEI
jgi:hypothetical protein